MGTSIRTFVRLVAWAGLASLFALLLSCGGGADEPASTAAPPQADGRVQKAAVAGPPWTFTDPTFFTEVVATLPPFTPVGLTWTPDGRMLVWTKTGTVHVVKDGALLPTPFIDISAKVNSAGDRGLLGLAVDGNYAVNGYVYLLYTYEEAGNPASTGPKVSVLTRVASDPGNRDVALAGSEVVIVGNTSTVPCPAPSPSSNCIPSDGVSHSIGTVRFGADGKLWLGSGDGSAFGGTDPNSLRSQSLDSFSGKIMRVNPDGTAPSDNPFYDGTNSVRSKIWGYGFRNPFRFNLHPITGIPYVGDVGFDLWEELNKGVAGSNFGWPCYEGAGPMPNFQASFPAECAAVSFSATRTPLYAYSHDFFGGSTVIGGPVYQGSKYPAQYVSSLFIADYSARWIRRVALDANGDFQAVVPFATGVGTAEGGLVDLQLGPDGYLYFVELTTGIIGRINNTAGNGGNLPPVATAAANPAAGQSPLTVAFSSAGSSDPQGFALTYLWNFGDGSTSTLPNPSHTYTSAGVTTFNVVLTVTSNVGLSTTANVPVTVGTRAPTAQIVSPGDGTQVQIGSTVTFQGTGTDPEDGTLPPAALNWTLLLRHNTHVHVIAQSTGNSGSFVVDNHDSSGVYAYELVLTATDSNGVADTRRITLPVYNPAAAPSASFAFGEGAGTASADLSGNGHGATLLNGTGWSASGKFGSALSFDGVDDAVRVAQPSTLNMGTSDFSVLTWIKRDSFGGRQRHIFSKCDPATWAPGCKEFYLSTSNILNFGSYATGDTPAVAITDTNWHHVAAVFTRATNTLEIYVDGARVVSAGKVLEADAAAHVVTIGNQGGTNAFSGLLDEVQFFPRAVTAGEILILMQSAMLPFVDTTPPVLSNALPTGTLAAGTTQATLSLSTNESATCRYATTAGTSYAAMTSIFATTGATSHSSVATGLANGQSYTYYVRCQDVAGNPTTSDLPIAFSVAAPDTAPPTVSLSAPLAGATVSGSVAVNASASDNVGVAGVQFLLDGANLGSEDTSAPYGVSWNSTTASNGTHTLSARARDAAGNQATSVVVSVTVSNAVADVTPPTVSVSAPAAGATVSGAVAVNASASDNVGVAGVQFLLDGANLGSEVTAAPYGISWNSATASNGTHTLSARARDAAGNQTTSAVVSVTVANAAADVTAPTVSLSAPAAGATVTGTVTVTASAADNVGVAGVQFLLDGANLGSEDTAAPFSVAWGSAGASNGTHTLSARARDAAGNQATSAGVSVTVSNAVPSGLVAALGFNESSGTTSADLSGNGHTATLVNAPAWVVGQYGNALSFNGTNNAVTLAAPGTLDFGASNFTIMLWAKRNALGGTAQRHLFSKCSATAWQSGCKEFYFFGNQLLFGSFATGDTASISVADTNWHHYAAVFTRATNTLQIYVDGTLRTTATKALEADNAAHVVTIGNHNNANPFSGLIDEVRIYNQARTAAQVVSDMNTPLVPVVDTTPPVLSNALPTGTFAAGTTQATLSLSTNESATCRYATAAGTSYAAMTSTFATTGATSHSSVATGLANGQSYTYYVRCQDVAGNPTTSDLPIAFSVAAPDTAPPTVSLSAPLAGATVSGTATVSASASDNVGVAGVQFLLDGANLGSEVTTAPYSVAWNTFAASNGAHTLSARARDAAGNQTTTAVVSVTVSNTLPTGLVAALGFNESSGTTSADLSGNGHTATLVNAPAWVVGQYGNALSFNGTNNAVTLAAPGTLDFGASNFTIMLWAKRNALGGTAQRHLFSKCSATAWQSGCKEFYFFGNQLLFGSFATGDTASISVADTNWHHYAAVFTRATNTLQIYVDGTLRTTATKALEADNAAHVVTIGNHNNANPFSGLIDEVRIYNQALTAAQVAALRLAPL